MEKYYIKTQKIENKPGQWNSVLCEIFNSKDEKLGEYIRYYHSFAIDTFHPFQVNGKDYALYSSDYETISLMSLPDCKPIELNPECVKQMACFCPVEIYIPRFKDTLHTRNQIFSTEEGYENCDGFSTLAFVSGCVWGDDSSWKLNLLDLSNVEKGELWYVNNALRKEWLYKEISIPLSKLRCCFEKDSPFPYAYNQVVEIYQDFEHNILKELEIKEHDIVLSRVQIDKIPKETKGTVVHIYEDKETYEVEFFKNEKTLSVVTVKKHQLKLLVQS